MKAILRFGGSDVERVLVNTIDLRERFNEIEGVAFVTSKLRPYRMSIDCDPQSVSPVSLLCLRASERSGNLLALGSRGLRFIGLLSPRIALANACGLTAKFAQLVLLSTTNASKFYNIVVIDNNS